MRRLAGAVLLALMLTLEPVGGALAQDASTNFCAPGQTPTFQEGFAALQQVLGDTMGSPVECEHPDSASGDTIQHTTTGLAFYRAATNTPTFTDGYDHWALTAGGLVEWQGDSIDPPGTVLPSTPTPSGAPAPGPSATPSPSPTSSPAPVASPSPSPSGTPSVADVAAQVGPSVVQVITDSGSGSGVVIAQGILTNAHVVDGAGKITVATNQGTQAPATLVKLDDNLDLALLKTSLSLPPLTLQGPDQQRQGDEVLVLGYPLGLNATPGGEATLTRGLISAITKDPTGRTLIQTDAAINAGNSGGAMVNMRGQLIGIPAYSVIGEGVEGVNFAIGADTVQGFLAETAPPLPPHVVMYRGDPTAIAPAASDIGPGWGVDQQDSSQLEAGIYVAQYSFTGNGAPHDPKLSVEVAEAPSVDLASTVWAQLATSVPPGSKQVPPPPIGDGQVALTSPGRYEVDVRVKNVILLVSESSQVQTLTADLANRVAVLMLQRVNTLAD